MNEMNRTNETARLAMALDRLIAGLVGAITLTLLYPLCRILLHSGF